MHKKELIKFWKSSASAPPDLDPGIFWRILQHCEIGHFFHKLAYVSGESDRIFMKISPQIYPWTRKSQLQTMLSLADICGLRQFLYFYWIFEGNCKC